MPRCSCGSVAPLKARLLYQGDVQRGWSHPWAVRCLHKATLRGVLRARICQVFNRCELLFGKQQRSGREWGSHSPAQAVGWLSRGSSSSLGMLQARQPQHRTATALQRPSLQIGHRVMLMSVFYALGRMTKCSRELKQCSCLEKWPDNGILSNFKGVWCPLCNTVVSY